jgi:hypothetical protein
MKAAGKEKHFPDASRVRCLSEVSHALTFDA